MIVGEADLDVHARTEHVDDEIRDKLNAIAARAGDRFGTLLGRAVAAPFRRGAVRAADEGGNALNATASRIGDRFGTAVGRGAAAPLRRALDRAGADSGRSAGGAFAKTFRGVVGGLAAVGLARGIFHQVTEGLKEFSAGERGVAQLNAALASTGGVVGLTVPQLTALADSIQRTTGADDDAVVAAEGLLLTFTKVRDVVGQGSDIFSRATRDARDLSVRGFGDLNATTLQLGKALNDPIRGVGALSRAGIQFTAGQRRSIQTMIETNDLLGAQKIILGEVEKQVGGSAVAFGKTFPGAVAITKERFANLRGEIVGRFVPQLLAGLGFTNHVMDVIEKHPERVDAIVRRVGGFIRSFVLGLRDMFTNIGDAIEANRTHIERISRVFGTLSDSTGSGSVLQSSLGLVGSALGAVVTALLTTADAYLTFAAAVGIHLGEATHFVANFVRAVDAGFGHVVDGVDVVGTALGGPLIHEAIKLARARFDSGLGDIADDLDAFANTMTLGGQRLGAALAGGIGQGLLVQAQSDPALAQALNTILGAPVGVGISPDELNKYADGVKLRDSFLAGINSPTGSAASTEGMIDDFDKQLSAAQKAAGDRARAIGNAVTQGIRDHLNAVKREVSALTTQRNKILDFRSSVLSAAGSFTKLSDLIDDPSTSTAGRIARALNNRLLGLQTFAKNLQTLAKRGLDKGVIAELALGGPEQRALSSALVAGNDAQIKQINATEKAVRQQQQVVASVATDAAFGPNALAKTNTELARLNAQVAALNKQIAAQPALIAKAVDAARKNATVSTKTSTRTAVAK